MDADKILDILSIGDTINHSVEARRLTAILAVYACNNIDISGYNLRSPSNVWKSGNSSIEEKKVKTSTDAIIINMDL
jgi:hypothetical protein